MFLFHASVVLFAHADNDEIDEEQGLTATQHQLWGFGSDKCSSYIIVEELVWQAESCAWIDRASESDPTR